MFVLSSKWLWPTAIFLIAGSWIYNVWYFQSMQLKEPVFLEHDSVVYGNRGDMIELVFLENKQGNDKVTGIQIEQLPSLEFRIQQKSVYTHQVMMIATAVLDPDEFKKSDPVSLAINEVTVNYNKGEPKKIPIGKLDIVWESSESLIFVTSSMSSTEGIGSYSFDMEKSAVLEKVDYTFSDSVKPWFKLTLSDQPIESITFPKKLQKGDSLTFEYEWMIPNHEPAALTEIKSSMNLHFRTEDGQVLMNTIPINYNLFLTNSQIRDIVRSRGDVQ